MQNYDPNDVGVKNGNIFSLPHQFDDAEIILLPVPWDATVSYNDGTCNAPEALLDASSQLDFYHPSGAKIWEYGVHQLPINERWKTLNTSTRKLAKQHIDALENNEIDATSSKLIEQVNSSCEQLKNEIKAASTTILKSNKLMGLVGGDHSCPLGFIEALSEQHECFGILQIDAHADLRETYENFTYSHASIFHKALQIRSIQNLTQVFIRDVSPNEVNRIQSDNRIQTFFDWDIKSALFNGKTWKSICKKIVATLPQKVYISFDIDGLQPSLCPNTGTPVPGGMSFEQACFLLDILVENKKQIIGFDLCEVGVSQNDEWDANVGARILFQLCTALHLSNTFS